MLKVMSLSIASSSSQRSASPETISARSDPLGGPSGFSVTRTWREATAGSMSVKHVPPGPVDSPMEPPCRSMIPCTVGSPSPVPCSLVVKKGSKICSASGGGDARPRIAHLKSRERPLVRLDASAVHVNLGGERVGVDVAVERRHDRDGAGTLHGVDRVQREVGEGLLQHLWIDEQEDVPGTLDAQFDAARAAGSGSGRSVDGGARGGWWALGGTAPASCT